MTQTMNTNLRHQALALTIVLLSTGAALNAQPTASPAFLELDLAKKTFVVWGGSAGKTLEQGDGPRHVKIHYTIAAGASGSPQEVGVVIALGVVQGSPRVQFEILSDTDTRVRLRITDARGKSFSLRAKAVGGIWEPLDLPLAEAKSNLATEVPVPPFKDIAVLAAPNSLDPGAHTLEIRNIQLLVE